MQRLSCILQLSSSSQSLAPLVVPYVQLLTSKFRSLSAKCEHENIFGIFWLFWHCAHGSICLCNARNVLIVTCLFLDNTVKSTPSSNGNTEATDRQFLILMSRQSQNYSLIRTNHVFKILSHQFKTQGTQSKVKVMDMIQSKENTTKSKTVTRISQCLHFT